MNKILERVDKKTLVKYVQFSKRIIYLLCVSMTIMCITGMLMCFKVEDTAAIVKCLQAYGQYALIAFACYTTNSISEKAFEKLLTNRISADKEDPGEDETSETEDGGIG